MNIDGRVDPPITRESLCLCPCHTDNIGLYEECCESATAWNAALDAVIKAHENEYDWSLDIINGLRK